MVWFFLTLISLYGNRVGVVTLEWSIGTKVLANTRAHFSSCVYDPTLIVFYESIRKKNTHWLQALPVV